MGEWRLSLRPADDSDCDRLFEWANDPIARANSFASEPISWSTHCAWLASVLRDPARALFVVLAEDNQPIGQVRFDVSGPRERQISISLAPGWRRRGVGPAAIRLATDHIVGLDQVDVVHALVKTDNESSRKAFLRAGYVDQGIEERGGQRAIHLLFCRPMPARPSCRSAQDQS